ncbi:MAG: nicotinate (nicotinamide) nucleotide adenylyltransferase [Clostridia bacterium]|nr:nicotinate (nicotinamide) nucleotide adenylyltransferase [Clostridia bacterium]
MRIGIYGGSFNPPHKGHIRLAEAIFCDAQLDKILIIPAGTPPHKESPDLAEDSARLAMCAMAFGGEKYEISDVEIKRGGKSYTVDTVAELRKTYPEDEFFLIIGSDMLLSFDKWYRYEDILKEVTLCVATREDEISRESLFSFAHNVLGLADNELIVSEISAFECSSTDIRDKIKAGENTEELLSDGVRAFIAEKGLYTDRYTHWRKLLRLRLLEKRYIHSLNVADSARHLAKLYGADEEKAYFAGLVHDIMKNADEEEQLQIMKKGGIILSCTEKANKKLWHAMAGECYLRLEKGITDGEILNAVRYHTTGRAGMSLLEKVVYIADYISAERDYDDVDVMRELSMNNGLDEAALYALKFSFRSLSKKEKLIHTDSVEYYNELIIERGEKYDRA